MSIKNVPLFDLFKPEEATTAQLLGALNDGVDPETGEYADELSDGLTDLKYMWSKERPEETPIGSFLLMSDWNHGDGHEQGIVIKHVETGKFFMATGTYSSWDSSDWEDWTEVQPYEFTETRYK